MGKRGPKPTPTAILKLRGSWRAGLRDGEPETQPEAVACPDWLSDKAKRLWPEVLPLLTGLGVMSRPFTVAAALLVDVVADWVELGKDLQSIEMDPNSDPAMERDIRKLKAEASKRAMAFCVQFGITPSAITAVRTTTDKKAHPLDRFKIA